MSIAALIRSMASAGAPPEAIALAVEAIEAAQSQDAERKARQAERKRRSRAGLSCDSHGTVTGQECDGHADPLPPLDKRKEPKENYSPPAPVVVLRERVREATDLESEFEREFWPAYPHKVGKPDAAKKFAAARRSASLPEILSGLDRYVRSKPADRPWCNPSTWLHQGRWADQPAPEPAGRQAGGPAPPKPRRFGDEFADFLRGDPAPQHDGRTIDGSVQRR